jgi:hypothetical protein
MNKSVAEGFAEEIATAAVVTFAARLTPDQHRDFA